LVAPLIEGWSLSARDTVDTDTFASFASFSSVMDPLLSSVFLMGLSHSSSINSVLVSARSRRPGRLSRCATLTPNANLRKTSPGYCATFRKLGSVFASFRRIRVRT
jgi:hypothetical protein